MTLPNELMSVGLLGKTAATYQVSRSLRFNSPDSAYLSRTPASAGNRKTWTWAGWVKRSGLGSSQTIFAAVQDVNNGTVLNFTPSDQIQLFNYVGGAYSGRRVTTPVYRDASAWYHILLVWDSANSTSANRIRLYVNGLEVTTFGTTGDPSSSDSIVNSTNTHYIGADVGFNNQYSNQYLADVFFIDGQALDPSSFTEVSATTGQLIPKAYTGSFGTNGFWLKFSDNSNNTASTLGKDSAGSNNWTPNNFSVTAGVGNDSLVDTPTSYGTDTGAGGEVRGNYCTWNPLLMNSSYMTAANGNLDAVCQNSNYNPAALNIHVRVGGSSKWYCEFSFSATPQTSFMGFGLSAETSSIFGTNQIPGSIYMPNGQKSINGTKTSYGNTYIAGDIIGVAIDEATGSLTCYKNGVSQGLLTTLTTGSYQFIGVNYGTGTVMTVNAGQGPFAYTAPSGFKSLCDTNLPAPVVANPSTVMDVKLYTGNGSTQTISGLGFSPDLVWIKKRSSADDNLLHDAARGNNAYLVSNSTAAEGSQTNLITSFNSDGFSLGVSNAENQSSQTYVAWCWDAGSSTVTNTQGSITSSVKANASSGFSVIDFTCQTSGTGTLGHGLGVAPEFFIYKRRAAASNWTVYHKSIGNLKRLLLNTTDAQSADDSTLFNGTSPSSSVITFGSAFGGNGSSIVYAFAPVTGYSSGFSYTGNGSTDGVFVYLGLRAKLLLIKRTDTTGNWYLWDTVRNTYNVVGEELYPNLSNAAATATDLDILSNGFKMRSTAADFNASGGTYVGFAWAEAPFAYSRAR